MKKYKSRNLNAKKIADNRKKISVTTNREEEIALPQ